MKIFTMVMLGILINIQTSFASGSRAFFERPDVQKHILISGVSHIILSTIFYKSEFRKPHTRKNQVKVFPTKESAIVVSFLIIGTLGLLKEFKHDRFPDPADIFANGIGLSLGTIVVSIAL